MASRFPRCSWHLDDGTRCARRVADGSKPALCHIHKSVIANGGGGPLTAPVELDLLDILRKLARDTNPQVRLRAVESLLDYKRKNAENERATFDPSFIDYATDEEAAEMSRLVARLKELRATLEARRRSGVRPVIAEQPSEPEEPTQDEPPTVADSPATVRVWQGDQLVTEPRNQRPWKEVE